MPCWPILSCPPFFASLSFSLLANTLLSFFFFFLIFLLLFLVANKLKCQFGFTGNGEQEGKWPTGSGVQTHKLVGTKREGKGSPKFFSSGVFSSILSELLHIFYYQNFEKMYQTTYSDFIFRKKIVNKNLKGKTKSKHIKINNKFKRAL